MTIEDFYTEINNITEFLIITCQNNPVEIQERISATMDCLN